SPSLVPALAVAPAEWLAAKPYSAAAWACAAAANATLNAPETTAVATHCARIALSPLVAHSPCLCQIFLKRLPIVSLPPVREVLAFAFGETCVDKSQFGSGALLGQLEFHNRVNTWTPVNDSPGLHNSFVGHELDMPSDNVPSKECESASRFAADFRGHIS